MRFDVFLRKVRRVSVVDDGNMCHIAAPCFSTVSPPEA